jgi:hypothetical protein
MTKAATEVLSNAREPDNQSVMLRNAVDEFLVKVRAAQAVLRKFTLSRQARP